MNVPDRQCDWLILVPTELERVQLPWDASDDAGAGRIVQLCGFGLVTAGVRAASLIARHRPRRVLMLGIAGAIGSALAVGDAYQFSRVACHGIGVGSGADHRGAEAIGWWQWPEEPRVGDQLPLATIASAGAIAPGTLLTVCAASDDSDGRVDGGGDVAQRLSVYPDATAEEMEGFAVAVACQLAGVPATIIRGISNRAGDRRVSNWKIDQAMRAAARLAEQVMRS